MIQNFSYLNRIPQYNDLIDIAFSKTNRKTPTIVRSKFEIHRIRNFYVRKVKFSSNEFITRLQAIVNDFPVLEDMHPFYADLINVLYDRDHYKIALGQVNTTKHRVESIAKEHIRLLNFADSLYRCKEIKKAALGKMATTIKKLSESLKYLEEVRQHMTRLPSIDTQARNLIICGFPNVGKSSFMNKITNAHVDVQNYAFTTKNIFVGHFEYKNLRWQILDTPGILDKPLQDRSSVEMLTITALAHLHSAILFFMDISESCGHTVEEQILLYNNLTPLLNLQILIVLSKADLAKLDETENGELRSFLDGKNYIEMSVNEGYNIEETRDRICESLLNSRIVEKEERMGDFTHRIKPYLPVSLAEKYNAEHIGPSPYVGLPENETYYCEDKYDVIPEIYNGKNIADFVDENISNKVEEVAKLVESETLRHFDIMNSDERKRYEDCNNARLDATLKAHFAKRASMPRSWKNKITTSGELVSNIKTAVPIIKKEKESFNRKIQRNVGKKYADGKPRHLMRPTGSKFARK